MKLGFTGRIARASAARPWLTIGVWALVLAAAIGASSQLGNALSQEDRFLVTVEAERADQLSEAARGDAEAPATETIVVTSETLTFTDAGFQQAVSAVVQAVGGIEGVADVAAPTLDAPVPVSASGHTALLTATLDKDFPDAVGADLNDTLAGLTLDGVEAYPHGMESAGATFDVLAEEGLVKGELIGIAAALVILVVVFGALVASGLPLVVGGVSIVAAVGATAIVGQVFELSFFIVNMITMMGLALGIDYSLVVVQRYREELAHGRTVRDAVAIAGDTASRAVFFSGVTVLISLAGMLIVPFTVMVSLGTGAMIVAVMAVAAALTLLPALLRLLGHRVNGGRLPFAHPGAEPRFWRALARGVMRRPVVGLIAGLGVLVAIAVPALSMRQTFPGTDALPQDLPFTQAVNTLSSEFGYGDSTTMVAIENAGGARVEVEALAAAIDARPAFAETTVEWAGDTAFIDTKDAFDSSSTEAEQAIHDLRDRDVPAFLDGTGATAHVSGEVAWNVDFNQITADSAPWVALIVLGSSLVLLLITFRSLVVAVTAVVLNALSTAAAYGALVAVFQWGWGAQTLGLVETGGITPWLPIFLFAVLFGLSMDYHVFLLSRIKERYVATGDAREAVEYGLSRTGSLITGAALIMVAVFAGFALGDLAEFAHMGVGLAVAVILDATVIRSLVVPALLTLLGARNWYLPRWLGWVPTVHIESAGHQLIDPVAEPATRNEDEPELAPVAAR